MGMDGNEWPLIFNGLGQRVVLYRSGFGAASSIREQKSSSVLSFVRLLIWCRGHYFFIVSYIFILISSMRAF